MICGLRPQRRSVVTFRASGKCCTQDVPSTPDFVVANQLHGMHNVIHPVAVGNYQLRHFLI